MSKVARDVAELEIEAWLDHKKVKSKKRESLSDNIEALVEAVEEGVLSFDEDSGELVQRLEHPVGENGYLKELRYKPRLKVGQVHRHLKGLDSGDLDGRMKAYICAITNQSSELIGGMDSDDYGIPNSIVVFFL